MERGAEPVIAADEPTPEQVLGWIAASRGTPWFPAEYSRTSGIPRDDLDRPLNELRAAELVRVIDWVRGVGQGYALTAEGETALKGRTPEPLPIPQAAGEEEDEAFAERAPVVTPALVYANLIWYFVGMIVALRLGVSFRTFLVDGDRGTWIRLGAVAGPELLFGEWWRLAACCFVHGTIWHLLVNVFNLVMIGALAEHLWGRWRVLVIYLVAGFAGSCLAMGLRPLDPSGRVPLVLVGASGALWGLAMSVVAWLVLFHRRLEVEVAADLTRRLALGFILSLAVNFLPNVSWEAHLGGAVAGFAAALLLHVAKTRRGWRQGVAVVLVSLMPALCMGGLLLAIRQAPVWAPFRTPPPVKLDPKPHLNALSTEAMKPAVLAASTLLMMSPEKRKPERVKEAREGVAALWSHAVEAKKGLEQPLADAAEEATRGKALGFANLRTQSLDRLLAMIDANAIPSVEEWKAWGELNRNGDRMWDELSRTP